MTSHLVRLVGIGAFAFAGTCLADPEARPFLRPQGVPLTGTTINTVPISGPDLQSTTETHTIPVEALPVEEQLRRLHKQVKDLLERLAITEKTLAEHRHTLTLSPPNAMNYRTIRYLLDNADQRDGLLYFPPPGWYRTPQKTSPPVMQGQQ